MNQVRMGVWIGVLVALLVTAFAANAGQGYWHCRDGRWTTVGSPRYPMPLKECDAAPRVAASAAACLDQGGNWGPIGIFPAPVCSLPTRDADRVCGDSAECEGLCLAELSAKERERLMHGKQLGHPRLGKCAARVPVMGCVAKVEQGVVRHLICFD